MKITILTLFKDVFNEFLNYSIIKRAIDKKIVEIEIIDFRDYSNEKNKQVDEYQYGGGPGMVLMLQPIVDAIKNNSSSITRKIMLTPKGKTFNQKEAENLKSEKHLLFLCGHYEGFDERIENYIDDSISVGDYILTGGELPALIIIESITRLLSDVINSESLKDETFNNSLLDYPVYTKPRIFDGFEVPEILFSGNHKLINEYRKQKQLENTKKKRPDLYKEFIKNK